MLIIDCCIRGNVSATRRYYKAYLKKYHANEKHTVLYLNDMDLSAIDRDKLIKRDQLSKEGFNDKMFDLAKQFKDADEILIAAPYWDLSFPALLKNYIERVSVAGLTFKYTLTGSVGLCKAKRILYFSTCGGFTNGQHLGYEYIKAVGELFGINECVYYGIEGLDIDPNKRNDIIEETLENL